MESIAIIRGNISPFDTQLLSRIKLNPPTRAFGKASYWMQKVNMGRIMRDTWLKFLHKSQEKYQKKNQYRTRLKINWPILPM